MCLSLRDDHGQAARLATNYDGLVISVLAEAQADGAPQRRTAGRCALRGMRRADVAIGDCARLAATVSLVLAAAKIRDHADDGDGAARTGRGARRRDRAGEPLGRRRARATGRGLGFEVAVLTEAVEPAVRRRGYRRARHSAAHGHRADRDRYLGGVRAHRGACGQARKRRPSPRRAGCSAGSRTSSTRWRISPPTAQAGAWNPLPATGAGPGRGPPTVRRRAARHQARARRGRVRRTHGWCKALLIDELGRSVRRTFARAGGIPTAKRIGVGSIAAAGIGGAPWLRRRRFCCGSCDDGCCECGCDACCEGCGDCDCCGGCCDGCDCSC